MPSRGCVVTASIMKCFTLRRLALVAFGLAVIPIGVWMARRFEHRLPDSLLGDIAGTNLKRAKAALTALGEFEGYSGERS